MSIFEPEETIGLFWHRLVGPSRSYRAYPQAAVSLDSMRGRIGLLFRVCGGAGGMRLAACAPVRSDHRLGLRQAIALGSELLERPAIDPSVMHLPASIDVFPEAADNAGVYEWLAAWFAHAAPPEAFDGDPLRDDIRRLRAAARATRATLRAWPGLRSLYARLGAAAAAVRPKRSLPVAEAAVEGAVVGLLREDSAGTDGYLRLILDEDAALGGLVAPRGYKSYLPTPLWGDVLSSGADGGVSGESDEEGGDGAEGDDQRRRAARKSTDRSGRDDPMILHRFESIFTIADMINVNRSVEDDEDHAARQALKDTPELTIGANRKRAATRLKLDLELSPSETASGSLDGPHAYPEWDFKKNRYLPAYCRVIAKPADEVGEQWAPDLLTSRNIRHVRRQFEALRPRRQILHGEPDGDDVDLSLFVRDVADRRAGAPGIDRVFDCARPAARDLSLALLMDVSLSTDAFVGERRVLDIEKGALLALAHGLSACGDEHAIYAFSSRRRTHVAVAPIKQFDERFDGRVTRRIAALRPGGYTRIGAAIRHVSAALAKRPHRRRQLLLVTDGKPNDIDHYEGRYGVEDTRMAVFEARRMGLCVFAVAIDKNARDGVHHIFGRGGYAIVADIARLPEALPAIYRQITT